MSHSKGCIDNMFSFSANNDRDDSMAKAAAAVEAKKQASGTSSGEALSDRAAAYAIGIKQLHPINSVYNSSMEKYPETTRLREVGAEASRLLEPPPIKIEPATASRVATDLNNLRVANTLNDMISHCKGNPGGLQAVVDCSKDGYCTLISSTLCPPFISTDQPFKAAPQFRKDDIHDLDQATLIELNRGSWMQCCFPSSIATTKAGAEIPPIRSYMSPFPGQSRGNKRVADLHVCDVVGPIEVQFDLDNLTHKQFLEQLKESPDAVCRLKLSEKVWLDAVKRVFPKVADTYDKNPFHFVVLGIDQECETNNLPISFDKVIVSKSHSKPDQEVFWSTRKGVGNQAQNPSFFSEHGDSPKAFIYNPTTVGNTGGASACVTRSDREPIYNAPSKLNSWQASRWLNRDWKDIYSSLAACERPNEYTNAYQIELPRQEDFKNFIFLAWFVLEHMAQLVAETGNEKPIQAAFVKNNNSSTPQQVAEPISFNRIYQESAGSAIFVTLIHKPSLLKLLREYESLYNADKLCLFGAPELLLFPVRGPKGLNRYNGSTLPAEYSLKVRLTLTPYMHANFESLEREHQRAASSRLSEMNKTIAPHSFYSEMSGY